MDRHEMQAAGEWLHTVYQVELLRPDGLWIDGHPDWEGIGAWLFDVYMTARSGGSSVDAAKAEVLRQIRGSQEWRDKHGAVPFPKPVPPPVPSGNRTWTRAQLMDIQGDLMVFVPELQLDWSGEVEPTTGIRTRDDRGATPRGLMQGWFWTLWIWTLPPAKRQVVYDAVRRKGWTHFAIGVQDMSVGDPSYHGLRHLSVQEQAAYGPLMNVIVDELEATGLAPICAGPAPGDPSQGGAPLAPGFDASRVRIAMSDWDNTNRAAERILYLAKLFPQALLYFERPQNSTYPQPDPSSGDPVTLTANPAVGSSWIHGIQQAAPNFVGVLYEVNFSDGLDKIVAEFELGRRWWESVDQNQFETNTYWKFWDGGSEETYAALEIQIRQRCTWLKGYMSGGPSHPAPLADPPSGSRTDEIDLSDVTVLSSDPACLGFPIAASFDSFGILPPNMSIRTTGAEHWPAVPIEAGGGPAQSATLWLFMQIGGKWHATGTERLRPNQVDGDKPEGQVVHLVSEGWLYDVGRWGPMVRDPQAGEVVGVMLVAGSTRSDNNTPARERTNVIRVIWPGAEGRNPLERAV